VVATVRSMVVACFVTGLTGDMVVQKYGVSSSGAVRSVGDVKVGTVAAKVRRLCCATFWVGVMWTVVVLVLDSKQCTKSMGGCQAQAK
jgi:hypothetical protein